MKISVAFLSLLGIVGVAGGQESSPVTQPVPQAAGLQTGQQAPAFTLPDQFGHEQSFDTLKGSKGTVLLFFRSADW